MERIILTLFLLLTGHAFAGGLPTSPYLYVQGSAELKVNPDTLTLSFGVNTTAPDQAEAKASVSEKSAEIFKLLAQLEIQDAAIAAYEISVNENYEFGSNRRKFNGYTVARNFKVTLTDFSIYPKLVDGLIELRVESMNGVQRTSSKAVEIKIQLKKAALDDARRQAEDLASGMNAKVITIFAASPIQFGMLHGAIFGGNGDHIVSLAPFSVVTHEPPSPDKYIFEQLTFSESLHAIFLIEPIAK